jgi:putative flippase GtrA
LSDWRLQGTRFVIVGLASNAALFLLYLLLTGLGLPYKAAVTLIYVVNALQTFVLNALWTFKRRLQGVSLVKYLLAYAGCYLLNMSALILLVDRLGLPHQAVQGGMIAVIAAAMFLLQKFWVFRAAGAT